MRPLYRNLFLLFGIVSVIIMMYGFGVDFTDLHQRIARVGLYLPAVVGIWFFVYAFMRLSIVETMINICPTSMPTNLR